MPGVHGGGMPALTFAKLTDFYYLRLAEAQFAQRQEQIASGEWGRLESLAPREPAARKLAGLGSALMSAWLLALLFRRRKQQVEDAPAELPGSALIQFPPVSFPSMIDPSADACPPGPAALR
jgi:hypothetical protein